MNTQEYVPVTTSLALTVRKEHRLIVVKRVAKSTARISFKILFYLVFLNVVNIFV